MKKVVFALAAALLCAAGAEAQPLAAGAENLYGADYSRPGYGYASVGAADVLKTYLGCELYAGEEEYLASVPEYDLKYYGKIPGNYIDASLDGGSLSVSAREYGYAAANGRYVVWKPSAVNGVPFGGEWRGEAGDGDYASVEYAAEFEYPAAELGALVNAYYNAVTAAAEKLAQKDGEYASAMEVYGEESRKYGDYLEALRKYGEDLSKYSEYLENLAIWESLNEPYTEYLSELAEYEAEKKAYDEYDYGAVLDKYYADMAAYYKYLEAKEEYDRKYEEYLAAMQLPEYRLIEEQLAVLEYAYKPCENRTLRNAVMGNAVTEVLSRKEDLKFAGVDGEALDRAEKVTRNLRDLITHYEAQQSRAARYSYYITSYAALRDSYTDLLRCLDFFYRNRTVRSYIKSHDKEEQFKILLAQLYETVLALNGGAVGNYEKTYKWNSPSAADFDGGYKIDGSSPKDILGENCLLNAPSSAIPLEDGYMELPEKPEEPALIPFPEYPEPLRPPVLPQEVQSPGPRPEEVQQPSEPAFVAEPVKPQKYTPSEEESRLAAAAGSVKKREERGESVTIRVTSETKKYFRGDFDKVTVFFFPSAGAAEPYFSAVSSRGEDIEFPKTLPQTEEEGYACVFGRWVYKDGSPVDFSNLPRNAGEVYVYPEFDKTPNLYDVYWIVGGETAYSEKVAFGQIPRFPGTPEKPDADGRKFRFQSWDKEPFPMPAHEVRYYALFESSCFITWTADGESFSETAWPGDMPNPPQIPLKQADGTRVRVFDGWDGEIIPVSGDATYNAFFRLEYIAPLGAGGGIVSADGGSYSADCTRDGGSSLSAPYLFALAAQDGMGITLRFSNCVLEFTPQEVLKMHSRGADTVTVQITRLRQYEYRYRADICGGGVNLNGYAGQFSATFTGAFKKSVSKLVCGGNELRFEADGSTVSFAMRPGEDYEIFPSYSVTVLDCEGAKISADKLSARRGEQIRIFTDFIDEGWEFQKFYVFDVYGNAVNADGGMFEMPASDVTVRGVCALKRYEVVFRSEGKIISRFTVAYGQMPTPPADPVKAPDGENSYTFAGWDGDFSPVTSDREYNALFTASPLPVIPSAGMPLIYKVLIAGGIAVSALLAVIAVIVWLALRKKRSKKPKKV